MGGCSETVKKQGCYMTKLTCLQFAATASQSLVAITPHHMCANVNKPSKQPVDSDVR